MLEEVDIMVSGLGLNILLSSIIFDLIASKDDDSLS